MARTVPAFPADFVSGEALAVARLNDIIDEHKNWYADRNAGGHQLANVALVANSLSLNAQNPGAGEGGEIILKDPTGADSWTIDNYQQRMRFFRGGGVAAVGIEVSGYMGVGVATGQPARLTVTGNSTNPDIPIDHLAAAALLVSDQGLAGGCGGEIRFGAGYGTWPKPQFAAIKGRVVSGDNNTLGDLGFYLRNLSTDVHLTERMRITREGRIGIGTSNPGGRLSIVHPTDTNHIVLGPNETDTYAIGRETSTGLLHFTGYQTAYSGFQFNTNPAGLVIRLNNNGYVGIGTGSPSMKTHIYGAGQAQAIYSGGGPHDATLLLQDSGPGFASGGALLLGSNLGAGYYAGIKGCAISGESQSVGDILFLTRAATSHQHLSEVMRVTYSARVGINKGNPGSAFAVMGLPSYANNAAAVAAGLTQGDSYLVSGSDPRLIAQVF